MRGRSPGVNLSASGLILLALLYRSVAVAQMPGVASEDNIRSRQALNALYGPGVQPGQLINVVNSRSRMNVADGQVEDPEGLLSGCCLQVARVGESGGLLAVLKNGQVLWHSDTTMRDAGLMPSGSIEAICNALHDHSLIIVVGWHAGREPGAYWFFRWDGTRGTLANAVNDQDEPGLTQIYSSWLFRFVDLEGDGILEVQTTVESQATGGDSLITHAWNGQAYGPWPGVPQPAGHNFLPRNRFKPKFSVRVLSVSGGRFKYTYALVNDSSSVQSINDLTVWNSMDASTVVHSPNGSWLATATAHGYGWFSVEDVKAIRPGDSLAGFSLECGGLPRPVQCYLQGVNGKPLGTVAFDSSRNDVRENSVIVQTVGPDSLYLLISAPSLCDSLSAWIMRARTSGWITSQAVASRYAGLFFLAKSQLRANDLRHARTTLATVLAEVSSDSASSLSSEAYALIRFNTEYLLSNLIAEH